jgi:hypothetical protein
MPYRTKIYVAFDGDTDIHYYYLMKAWTKNEKFDFEINDAHDINYSRDTSLAQSIKNQLRVRLQNSRVFILLVGENTKYLRKFVPWEIEYALKNAMPIIVVNLNGRRDRDNDRCPLLLRDALAVHVSFNHRIIQYAIDNWPGRFGDLLKKNEISARYYTDETYRKYGL